MHSRLFGHPPSLVTTTLVVAEGHGRLLRPGSMTRLEAEYLALNRAALRRRLTENEKKLARMCPLKMQTRRKEAAATA